MPGEDELIEQRRQKLERLRARGDAYPARAERTHAAADAISAFERWEAASSPGDPPSVSVAGRITSKRDMGKASFLDLRDGTGRIQTYLKKDVMAAGGTWLTPSPWTRPRPAGRPRPTPSAAPCGACSATRSV